MRKEETNDNYVVYCHTNNFNNKKYIGITKENTIYKRWQNGKGYSAQIFGRAINKYGWDNFKHEILYHNLTQEEAKEKEIELIKIYHSKVPNGYNVSDGGEITRKDFISIYCFETNEYFDSYENAYESHKGVFKNKYSSECIKKCCNLIYPYLKIPYKNEFYHYQLVNKNMIMDINEIERVSIQRAEKTYQSNISNLGYNRYHYKKGNVIAWVDNPCCNCGYKYRANRASDLGLCSNCKKDKVSILRKF